MMIDIVNPSDQDNWMHVKAQHSHNQPIYTSLATTYLHC